MRQSRRLMSIAPNGDETVYLVADDFGRNRRAWREADLEMAEEAVIQDLLAGEYRRPIKVIAFNKAERCSEDVSEDIAITCPQAEHRHWFCLLSSWIRS